MGFVNSFFCVVLLTWFWSGFSYYKDIISHDIFQPDWINFHISIENI